MEKFVCVPVLTPDAALSIKRERGLDHRPALSFSNCGALGEIQISLSSYFLVYKTERRKLNF